ncbi:MAG: lipid II flippase MurJ, partial [Alphaproteobacteria bacterium]
MALIRSIATVGGWTMASRVLGFARDILIARYLGAGPVADAFFVAFKAPNFFRRLFAEGAFNIAFVPVLSDYRQNRSFREVPQLINRTAGVLGSTLV